MIISNQHPCIYSAFSLLGKFFKIIILYFWWRNTNVPDIILLLTGRLLRAFPLQDKNQIVHDISEQLCVLIQSGQGSTFIFHVYEKLIFNTPITYIFIYTLYIYNLINFLNRFTRSTRRHNICIAQPFQTKIRCYIVACNKMDAE